MDRPLVSVIIATHNGMNHIAGCLGSLFAQNYQPFEVIVVDNASTDGLSDYLARHHPAVRCLSSHVNLAYGAGNNLGASAARGDFLLFLNHDTYVSEDFLVELMNVVERQKEIGIAQSKIMMASSPELIDSVGAYLTMTGMWVHPHAGESDQTIGTTPTEILGACGACMIVRRDLFDALGGFDPDFLIYFDDADFCWRARLLGSKVVSVPKSVIYHWGGATTRQLPSVFTVYHSFKNRLCSLIKLLSAGDLLIVLPVHLGLCLGGVLTYVLRRKPANGAAIVRALGWNVRNLRNTLIKRRAVRRAIRIGWREGYRHLLRPLLTAHFIRTSLDYVSQW